MMEITLEDLWFVMTIPSRTHCLPGTAFCGDIAEAEARAVAERLNADPTLHIGGFRLTYKAVGYYEALSLVNQNA